MEKIISAEVMRSSDAYACLNVTDARTLMLRAGQRIYESYGSWGRTAVVCGSGNNGGDGYVLAMLIKENGGDVTLFTLSDKFSESGRYYFDACARLGVRVEKCSPETEFKGFDTVADCIFGTGFHGDVTGLAAVMIDRINESGAFVVSADINSGLSSDSGRGSVCVVSDLTVSIGNYKHGHFLGMAKDVMGSKVNADIGIDIIGRYACLFDKAEAASLISKRKNDSNKGTYGYVGIMGGCAEYSGAVKLANLGASALRSGCGVAKLIVPRSIAGSVSPYVLESTLCSMDDKDGHMLFRKEAVDAATERLAALSVGMGWGDGEENERMLSYILSEKSLPLIIDADGLNALGRIGADALKNTGCSVVLTPHPKEFERISGIPVSLALDSPVSCAESFAREYGVILLLKGASTVITDGEHTYICDRGSAGMATAGSGDVLSGVLTGLMGYMEYSPRTVALGAYIAGRAGELAAEEYTETAMLAGDTAGMIPRVLKELRAD